MLNHSLFLFSLGSQSCSTVQSFEVAEGPHPADPLLTTSLETQEPTLVSM